MRRFNRRFIKRLLMATMGLLLLPLNSQANVCSTGTGLPPFLDAGAAPNLLLALDNSGSMLDVAYVNDGDPDLDNNGIQDSLEPDNDAVQALLAAPGNGATNCYDDRYLRNDDYNTTTESFGFDYAIEYVGYFGAEHSKNRNIERPRDPKLEPWYYWVDDVWPSWVSGAEYTHGTIILENGIFYRAVCDDLATCDAGDVDSIEEDTGSDVTWARPDGVEPYVLGQSYGPNSTRFARYENDLYYTDVTTDAYSVGANPLDDTAHSWQAVEYTWRPSTAYQSGDIVSYQGAYYQALSSFTSKTTSLLDDIGTIGTTDQLLWQRLDEGHWQEWKAGESTSLICADSPSFAHFYNYDYPTYDANGDPIVDSNGDPVTENLNVTDVRISIFDADGDQITASNYDFEDNPAASVGCFAARSNFMNWATASKFDIQKMILTGGKYDAGYEAQTIDAEGNTIVDNSITNDTDDDRLVAENRGCAGSAFVKQITLDATNDIKLTLRVRGSDGDDWVDTHDDTTRLDILSVQETGFDITQCQGAVDEALKIQSGEISGGGQFKQEVDGCLTSNFPDKDTVNPALNHALQYCWFGWREGAKTVNRDLNTIIGDCQVTYEDRVPNPDDILVSSDAYNCSGFYDEGIVHDERKGYVGRCWDLGENTSGAKCDPTLKSMSLVIPGADCNSDNTACEWWLNGDLLRFTGSSPYVEYCTQFDKNNECKNDNKWATWYTDPDIISPPNDPKCDPTQSPYVDAATAGFSDFLIPPNCEGTDAPECDPAFDPEVPIKENKVSAGAFWCIFQAMEDYCDWLQVPQAIDPSDKANITGDLVNMPAQLIDAGVIIQLGIDKPLKVYKGYVKYELPVSQTTDDFVRPDGPRRVLYSVSNTYDIRIGAMAFNDVGSDIECDSVNVSPNVTPYCPENNRDGASIISQIKRGKSIDEVSGAEDWDHHNNLVRAINDTKATSWTPLAEAFYVALGYLGQDPDKRLFNPDQVVTSDLLTYNDEPDFYTATEAPSGEPWPDPVQSWCQENHVLIITEGASTADIHGDVAALAAANPDTDTGDGECTQDLYGSTYFDDLTYFGRDGVPYYVGAGESSDDPRDATDVQIEAPIGHPGTGLLGSGGLFTRLLPTGDIDIGAGTEIYAKQPIQTHIVTTGTPRGATGGTGECNPATIMENAADNGGTDLLSGENPRDFESKLEETLRNIAQRVSTGSAASVIASSRSGEGAVYQAVFWPEIPRESEEDGDSVLNWVGDVHGFFIDSRGQMWDDHGEPYGVRWSEDINGNGINDEGATDCLAGDRRVHFIYDGTNTRICHRVEPDVTTECYQQAIVSDFDTLVVDDCPVTCSTTQSEYCDTNYTLGPELQDFDSFVWSANDRLQEVVDINTNRSVDTIASGGSGRWDWDGTPRRYIFTWSDINNNGIVDTDLDYDGFVDSGDPVAGTIDTSPATDEVIELDPTLGTDWSAYPTLLQDFMVASNTEMNEFLKWLRGDDGPWEFEGTDSTFDVADDLNGNGIQDYKYRCRREESCYQTSGALRTPPESANNPIWRLGDIIHSTPKLVAQPAEAFHTIYRDPTYAEFIKRYRYRRNMIYFGTSMLHAVNGGFYDSDTNAYYENFVYQIDDAEPNPTFAENLCFYNNVDAPDTDTTTFPVCPPASSNPGPKLGMEMSAFVPLNLQPHLKCLSDPDYGDDHKYFVDKEPRIFDMRVFEEEDACKPSEGGSPYDPDCIHPKGWGTILVGAMRFGGAPITAADPGAGGEWDPNDNRQFISSYFVMDITDPERPPRLLGEMTRTTEQIDDPEDDGLLTVDKYADLGFSTPMVTGVVGQNEDTNIVNSKWYLVFGNGPTTLKGENTLDGTVGILPMSWLTGTQWNNSAVPPNGLPKLEIPGNSYSRQPFRFLSTSIEDATPSTNYDEGGIMYVPQQDNGASISFLSDLMTLDLTLQTRVVNPYGGIYNSDAVYFGTVDGAAFSDSVDPSTGLTITSWDGGGRVYRLVTSAKTSSLDGTDDSLLAPSNWHFKKLFDAGEPISSAPSAGWDGANFWIYFGSGRFFATEDKTDASINHFFGIKEPLSSLSGTYCEPTWLPVSWNSASQLQTLSTTADAGSRGLFRSDWTVVPEIDLLRMTDPTKDPLVACDTIDEALGKCDLSFLNTGLFCDDPTTEDTIETLCDYYRFEDLQQFIAGEKRDASGECSQGGGTQVTGIDGWYLQFHEPRERVIGQSSLLGGLTTFTTYQPFNDQCSPEGVSYLYGVHYQTGTAWYENVFGLYSGQRAGYDNAVLEKYSLGTGLATTPSLHTGSSSNFDAKAFVQTSTGAIKEIGQENLPIKPPRSGRLFWNDDQNPKIYNEEAP